MPIQLKYSQRTTIMKKILSLLIILFCMLNISACTGNSSFETTDKVSHTQITEQTSNTKKTVGTIITTKIESTTASNTSIHQTYILNTNTLKFHYESCRYVTKISSANKSVYEGTREEIIKRGYSYD